MFGYVLIKASLLQQMRDQLVRLERAQRLARNLTDEQIDSIWAGKAHIHKNQQKKKATTKAEFIVGAAHRLATSAPLSESAYRAELDARERIQEE